MTVSKKDVLLPGLEGVAPLEPFDPRVFLDDDPAAQKVCDFVLALALIFNDFKDLVWAKKSLTALAPDFAANFHETSQWGHFTGLDHHLHRLQASLIVELARLLDASSQTIALPQFQAILECLDGIDQRAAWVDLTNPNSDLRDHLTNVRDKIAFHYWPSDRGAQKVLRDGFRAAFEGTGRIPLVSRGDSLINTRFYFADAAALDMEKLIRSSQWLEAFDSHAERISNVLFAVVMLFIENRRAS